MEPEQLLWVARFTGRTGGLDLPTQLRIALSNEEVEAQAQRQHHLAQMRRDVAALKKSIADAYHADIQLKTGEAMKMIASDQTQAFDWWEDVGKLDMEKFQADGRDQKMSEAKASLTLIEQRLINLTFLWSRIDSASLVRDDKKPLFDTATITEELYTPLVREQILPETFVENEFSQVQQMITASNDVYMQELAKVSENKERDENIALAKAALSTAATIAIASVDIDKAGGGISSDKAKVVDGYITLVKEVLTTGMDLGAKFADGSPEDGIRSAFGSVSKSAGFVVEQITGSKKLGEYVKASMNATKDLSNVIKELGKGDATKVCEALVEVISEAFDIGGSSVDEESAAKKKLSLAKQITVNTLKGLLIAKKVNIFSAFTNKKWGEARTILVVAVSDSTKTGFSTVFPVQAESSEENQDAEGIDNLIQAEVVSEEEQSRRTEAARKTEEAEKKAAAEEKLQAEEALAEEQRQFTDSMELLGQRETLSKGEMKKIGDMIAQLKRDATILSTAVTIGTKGFDAAKAFLAPLAIGGTLVKFAATLASAIDRAIAMRKWADANKEALTAVSPYLTSIQNFVKNQKEQFAHKSITAAIILLRAAAQLTASLGTGTPVQAIGTIIDKGLSMVESLEDLTFKIYQRAELEKAWAITRRALDTPDNRKANLLARGLNPTLAKYSIAYGAVEAKDVIAISAMERIGLTRETLAQEDAKVSAVKEYLELLYADDIAVKRHYESPSGWAKDLPTPALNARTWMLSIQVAIKGGHHLSQDGAINAALKRSTTTLESIDKAHIAKTLTAEMIEGGLADLKELSTAFKGFTSDASELKKLADHYLSLVNERAGELGVLLSELPKI